MLSPYDLVPLLSAFAIVAAAEFGDKTQMAVICLSAKHKPKPVFIGAVLAFTLVDGISAIVGGAIAPFIPKFWIGVAAGISFLIFGIWTLLSKEDLTVKIREHSKTVITSFILIGVMELGDKTQLAVIALSAEYKAPLQVFVGVVFALALLTGLGVIFGKILSRYVSGRYVKISAGLIFLAFGVLFLAGSISGHKII